MKFQNIYNQVNKSEIQKLIDYSETCLLVTRSLGKGSQFGVFNPTSIEGKLFLHHSVTDEQVTAMRENNQCKLIFQDILGIVPSYWVDPKYAGAATTYYRYAELDCQVRLIEKPMEQIKFLKFMMSRFQPEGGYDAIDYQSSIYKKKLESILITEFTIQSIRTKWKLGQNQSAKIRSKIAKKFKENGNQHCADEIECWSR